VLGTMPWSMPIWLMSGPAWSVTVSTTTSTAQNTSVGFWAPSMRDSETPGRSTARWVNTTSSGSGHSGSPARARSTPGASRAGSRRTGGRHPSTAGPHRVRRTRRRHPRRHHRPTPSVDLRFHLGEDLGVPGLVRQQLGVGALGDHPPVLDHGHPVGQRDRRQAVGDDQRRALASRPRRASWICCSTCTSMADVASSSTRIGG